MCETLKPWRIEMFARIAAGSALRRSLPITSHLLAVKKRDLMYHPKPRPELAIGNFGILFNTLSGFFLIL